MMELKETEAISSSGLDPLEDDLRLTKQELDALCYAVSHDLRAPLRSISGFGRALEEDFGEHMDTQAKHYIARILGSATQMESMLTGLLNLSKTTRVPMKIEKINMSDLVLSKLLAMQAENPMRCVQFHVEKEVLVSGDRMLLSSAVGHLIENAWKFTRNEEQVEVAFGVEAQAPPITCFIRDNGVGFDMAYAGRLFSAFQTLHRREQYSGNGIGLATVQRIVRRHGGRTWADARPNQGATFYFQLPPCDEEAPLHQGEES